MNPYPFINPIIVTKDNGIIDGLHRSQACELMNAEVKTIEMNFSSEQANEKAFLDELNQIQDEQKEMLENYFKANNVDPITQLTQCSSRDRMEKFFEFQSLFTTREEYTSRLIECYTLSNNNYRFAKQIKDAFSSPLIKRKHLMEKKDRKLFDKLPSKLTIYRGMSEAESKSGDFGISWTLKKTIAEQFAKQYLHNYDSYDQNHLVKELTVNKEDVLAYYGGRSEEEIIYIQ